jgi:hypothetical protein
MSREPNKWKGEWIAVSGWDRPSNLLWKGMQEVPINHRPLDPFPSF